MIICIPADGPELNAPISYHFGRAPYYIFIELGANKEVTRIDPLQNPAVEHNPGEIPRWIAEHKATAIIVLGIGSRAVDWFNKLGIEVYSGNFSTVQEALEKFRSGTLQKVG